MYLSNERKPVTVVMHVPVAMVMASDSKSMTQLVSRRQTWFGFLCVDDHFDVVNLTMECICVWELSYNCVQVQAK